MQHKSSGYEKRLYAEKLAEPNTVLFGTPGNKGFRNQAHPACKALSPLFEHIRTETILYARPAQPYATALYYLAETDPDGVIRPEDSETRMFLHDLPVVQDLDVEFLAPALENRKCTIVKNHGIIARGKDEAEAYVNFSAACFSGIVKFFSDTLQALRTGELEKAGSDAFFKACKHLPHLEMSGNGLMAGPFETQDMVQSAVTEAGRQIVGRGLVNACFGNISYRTGDTLYISSSGSFLDELEHDIVRVSIKDGSCTDGKPSSELPAHLEIAASTDFRAILHGHPLFCVIMSMDCTEKNCTHKGRCHLDCPVPRQIGNIPIVPGETGGGRFGLNRTVPAAVKKAGSAIVYGHGVFTCAANDFNSAMGRMIAAEGLCRRIYFERIGNRL